MKWYWHRAGGHTHVRVFMNGAKCGDLCFRNEEFDRIWDDYHLPLVNDWLIQFIEHDETVDGPTAAECDDILGKQHYRESEGA